ncbi:TetR/AcrR family transcriptional regulator [Sphingomonas immobilis]|uniref:TetR/AcrR family transcriptional regulator n=1 Tax=Sphingomonas immobilis TaxID=3063997 RepID=UPI00272A36D2|nr:TetR/AcrR family transcriptional regulator [Sphingomonas sp. CA1-15]
MEARAASPADATRARILLAAQQAFSSRGYGDVGLRAIATAAGCDTTLIRRYFGPKQRLFEEALSRALDVTPLLDSSRENFGARAVAFFTQENDTTIQPIQMLIFATADPVSRATALRLLERHVIAPIAAWLGGGDGAARAARISMLCSGWFLYSRVLPLPGDADGEPGATNRWLAAQLQLVVDEAP